jgi:hypothetical protein
VSNDLEIGVRGEVLTGLLTRDRVVGSVEVAAERDLTGFAHEILEDAESCASVVSADWPLGANVGRGSLRSDEAPAGVRCERSSEVPPCHAAPRSLGVEEESFRRLHPLETGPEIVDEVVELGLTRCEASELEDHEQCLRPTHAMHLPANGLGIDFVRGLDDPLEKDRQESGIVSEHLACEREELLARLRAIRP